MDIPVTVGEPVGDGWRCVDDAGRPVVLPRSALPASLRTLRVGQRLLATVDAAGVVVSARLP